MKRKDHVKVLAVGNTLGLIGTIVVNYLANAIPLNGKTTGELSNQYPNLFTPAAITFAIWGLIYLLLAIFCAYQLYIAFKEKKDVMYIDALRLEFMVASIANMSWIFAWHYERIGLSVGIMIILLVSLIQCYRSLKIDYKKRSPNGTKYFLFIPISVYLGWISIATIANIAVYLVSIQWNGFGLSEAFWAVSLIVVGILLGFIFMLVHEDIYYALVIDWALLGIFLKRISEDVRVQSVIFTAILGMIILTLNVLMIVLRKNKFVKPLI